MEGSEPEWLEPPDWWKKWRPLRWLAAALVLGLLYVWLVPASGDDVAAPPPVARTLPVVTPVTETPAPAAETAVLTPVAMAAAPTATPAPSIAPQPSPEPSVPQAEAPSESADESEVVPEAEEEVHIETLAGPQLDDVELAAFTRGVTDPVRLLGNYRSYESVDDVVFDLERAGFLPVVESRHLSVREGVPKRDLDSVVVSQFRHWDVSGRLELQFFNDRLYQVEFEPEDAEAYQAAQRRNLPQIKRQTSGRSEYIAGHLRVASSLDLSVSEVGNKLRTRPFLLWQDRRLVRQRDEWDRRFAVAAAE